MQRRKSLELIAAGFSPFFLITNSSIGDQVLDSNEWLANFKIRWNNSRIYCFEIFDGMPFADFSFKPNPEIMSFGKLFVHIGSSLYGYASVLDGSLPDNEAVSMKKSEVSDYLESAFTRFNNALDNIIVEQLYDIKHAKSDEEPWNEFSIFDIITLGYNHTTHHIAQATVYLRLRNIVPPKYRF